MASASGEYVAARDLRRLGVVVVALAAWLGLSRGAWWLVQALRADPTDTDAARLDALLAIAAVGLAWLLVSWLVLGVLISALATMPEAVGGALARWEATLTPALVRKGVAALVGGAVLAGPVIVAPAASAAVPVSAAPQRPTVAASHDPAPPAVEVAIDGTDVVFDRLVNPKTAGVTTRAPEQVAQAPAPIEVRRGDTLWGIAARHLGPGATPAQIAAAWPLWHAANRDVIGADPGLILPGQLLTPPTP